MSVLNESEVRDRFTLLIRGTNDIRLVQILAIARDFISRPTSEHGLRSVAMMEEALHTPDARVVTLLDTLETALREYHNQYDTDTSV